MKPNVLIILDGWGYSKAHTGNAIQMARKPNLDMIDQTYPKVLLQASGLAVGMNWGELGNSEVGHVNIGAGRSVIQYQSRIRSAIKDGSFFTNDALVGAFNHSKKNNSSVHIAGLLTSGTVHADFVHLEALLDLAKDQGVATTYLHLFLDGKDSGLEEGIPLLEKVMTATTHRQTGIITTIVGRNFAMDRDNNWDLTKVAYDAIASGKSAEVALPLGTLTNFYSQGIYDLKIPPMKLKKEYVGVNENDAIIFFNFREDSIRQLYKSFADPKFDHFARKELKNLYIASMTEYVDDLKLPVAFYPPDITNNISEVISNNNLKQLHIAETVKYAHVTYFFNGLRNEPYKDEEDVLIKTVKDIETEPAMSASLIATRVVDELKKDQFSLIVINFANADMLAHTGNYEATLRGIEAIDLAIGPIINEALSREGTVFITSDHGNAESLIYTKTGEKESKHDDSPVPFYIINNQFKLTKPQLSTEDIAGISADIAPTILENMNIQQPAEMTGKSLLEILKSKV